MNDFEKFKAEYDEEIKSFQNLLDKYLNKYKEKRYDVFCAQKLAEEIDDFKNGHKHLDPKDYIRDKDYWILFKTYPSTFREYLLALYEESAASFSSNNTFYDKLLETGEIAFDILKSVYKKHENDSGIKDHVLNTRGHIAEDLAKINEDGQVFLLDEFKNGSESDQLCALIGLEDVLVMTPVSKLRDEITVSIKNNLKNQYSSVRWVVFGFY